MRRRSPALHASQSVSIVARGIFLRREIPGVGVSSGRRRLCSKGAICTGETYVDRRLGLSSSIRVRAPRTRQIRQRQNLTTPRSSHESVPPSASAPTAVSPFYFDLSQCSFGCPISYAFASRIRALFKDHFQIEIEHSYFQRRAASAIAWYGL